MGERIGEYACVRLKGKAKQEFGIVEPGVRPGQFRDVRLRALLGKLPLSEKTLELDHEEDILIMTTSIRRPR